MLRKAVVSLFIAMIGLFAFSGMAAADPTDYPGETADPQISAPATADAGGTVPVTASGFAPNEAVIISIVYPDGSVQSALVVADADGNLNVPVPLVLSGTYSITANGLGNGRSATTSVTVTGTAPVSSAPVSEQPSSGPTQVVNGSVIVGVNNGTIIVNNGVIFYGEGFIAGENVTINIVYYGADAVKADKIIVVADADGKVRHEMKPAHPGKVVYQASGSTGSGEVAVTVTGTGSDSGWAAVATTTVAGKNVIAVAPNGTYLASTGASIAGPIAIGGAALVVGLGLLFFGTRGAIRRKGGHVQS